MSQTNKKKRFTKSGWFKLIIFILIIGAVGLVYWYFTPKAAEAPAAAYTAQEVTRGNITRSVAADGSLSAGEPVAVDMPYALSKLTYLVRAGDVLAAGDAVAKIDAAEVGAALTAIRSSVTTLDQRIRMLTMQHKDTGKVTAPSVSRVKEIYAQKNAWVNSVMTDRGALLLLSGDGKMLVHCALGDDYAEGDALTAVIDGKSYDAVVREVVQGVASVTFSDDGPAVGAEVILRNAAGEEVGRGVAAVSAPIYITHKGGKVSALSVSVNQKVNAGAQLLALSDLPYSDEYYAAVAEREDLGEAYATLLEALDTGVLVTDRAGIVESTGGAALVNLYPGGANILQVSVDEADIASIAVGQTALVTVDAVRGAFEGVVTRVAQSGTGSIGAVKYAVEITVAENKAFLIGMSAQATIVIDSRENVLRVPQAAIYYERGQQYVYRAVDGVTENIGEPGEKVYITTGLADATYAEVLTGLSEGDRVLILDTQNNTQNSIFFQENIGMSFNSGPVMIPEGGGQREPGDGEIITYIGGQP
ncbi:MAG: efflux RND transporter periplasmic adaptor subunit [Clostridiales bacterium]|nr:efflux RND transporter periplasmic adaptor subunit [Clostridiales bacterium]